MTCKHIATVASNTSPMAWCGLCGKRFDMRGVRSRYERIASDHPVDDPLDPNPDFHQTLTFTGATGTSNPIVTITFEDTDE